MSTNGSFILQHDTTVACMTNALGVYNGVLPPYAATFLIELYSDDNGYDVTLNCM